MATYLVTRLVEYYAYVNASSAEKAKQKADSKNVKWSRTMNLKPLDGIAEKYNDQDLVEEISDPDDSEKDQSELTEADCALIDFKRTQEEYEAVKNKYQAVRAYAMTFVGKGIDPDHFA